MLMSCKNTLTKSTFEGIGILLEIGWNRVIGLASDKQEIQLISGIKIKVVF